MFVWAMEQKKSVKTEGETLVGGSKIAKEDMKNNGMIDKYKRDKEFHNG